MENESRQHIKVMRFDWGGEFTPKEFKEFSEANENWCLLTVPQSLLTK